MESKCDDCGLPLSVCNAEAMIREARKRGNEVPEIARLTAELIAARRKLAEAQGLVAAAVPFVSPVQNADYARQLRQHDALQRALAAIKEPKT